MGKGHIAVNKYISNKARFADLINGGYFGGEQIVLPEQLEQVTGEYEILIEDKNGKSIGKTRYRDVVMRWKNEIDFCFIAYENQSKIYYAMPVRDILYDSMSYTTQIAELWKSHNKGKNEELEPAEYLSHFRKEDKIYPVLTIVFYYGAESWDGNRDLYSMFRLSDPTKEILKKYVPNYWINVFEADNIEDITCFKTDLQKIIGMLKCKKDKSELVKYVHENKDFFGSVDYNTQQVIGEFLQSEQLVKKLVKRKSKEESYNMCKALDDLYQDGVEKGREEMRSVIDEYYQDGVEKGREEMRSVIDEYYQDGVEKGREEMRSVLDEYYQDGVEKGREEMRSVIDEYYQDGVEKGREESSEAGIQNLVEASQEYGQSREAATSKLIEKYYLTQEVAEEKVKKYWK